MSNPPSIEQIVEDIGQASLYYEVVVQGYKALMTKRPDVEVDVRKFGAVFDGRNNQDKLDKAAAEVVSQGGGWLLLPSGTSLFEDWNLHPMINVRGPGTGACWLTIAPGAAACGIRCLAKGQPTGPTISTFSWRPVYRGFLINGNRANQVNVVDGEDTGARAGMVLRHAN